MTQESQNFAFLSSNTLRWFPSKVLLMRKTTEILAENLTRLMTDPAAEPKGVPRPLTDVSLGKMARIAANTVKNCRTGKNAASLTVIEKLSKSHIGSSADSGAHGSTNTTHQRAKHGTRRRARDCSIGVIGNARSCIGFLRFVHGFSW